MLLSVVAIRATVASWSSVRAASIDQRCRQELGIFCCRNLHAGMAVIHRCFRCQSSAWNARSNLGNCIGAFRFTAYLQFGATYRRASARLSGNGQLLRGFFLIVHCQNPKFSYRFMTVSNVTLFPTICIVNY
jgi:hypothetical protein